MSSAESLLSMLIFKLLVTLSDFDTRTLLFSAL